MADQGPLSGQMLGGRYQLYERLGSGGFADVYRGEHVRLKTLCAIKVLHTRLTGKHLDRFESEARTVAHLNHPNILQVRDFDIDNGMPFLVMDYASNGTLRDRHPSGSKLPLATVVPYIAQVAEALHYAHEQNPPIVHRDIKPENLLIGPRGEILLSDFGIAIAVTEYIHPRDAIGTAAYMAPEQFREEPHRASDQYALGIVVYEWLCGARPFKGDFLGLGYKHVHEPPPALRAADKAPWLPSAVEQVVLKALAKDPADRFESVRAFAQALERAAAPQKTKEQWKTEGDNHWKSGQYKEALAAYEEAIKLDPNFAIAYNKGNALSDLKRHEEALAAYEQALRLDPKAAFAWNGKGNALYSLKRYEEALAAYEQALRLDPKYAHAYNNKGAALKALGRAAEAEQAYQQARALGYQW